MARLHPAAMSRAPMPAAFMLCLFATTALAQPAPAAAPKSAPAPAPASAPAKADDTVSEVVVTGTKAAQRTSIDRITYDVSKDLTAANGTVSDVLRNLPSVDVDVEGNVALRGESSVQILVDGKPSPMFSGASRAQALAQLPANTLESIEVMTNPSAEFSPDGTGGVINLVTKTVKKPGRSASVQAAVGSFGRWSSNVVGTHKDGPLSLSGNLGLRRETSSRLFQAESTRVDPITGSRIRYTDDGGTQYAVLILTAGAALDYDLTSRDRLSLSGSVLGNDGEWTKASHQVYTDGEGLVTRDYTSPANRGFGFGVTGLSASWRRTFAEPGRTFNLTARLGRVNEHNLTRIDYLYATPAARRTDEFESFGRSGNRALLAAYATPLLGEGTLKAGYDYRRDASDVDNIGRLIDPAGGFAPRPDVSNRFIYVAASHQAYATYQRPFGKLSVLGGLRLEQAFVDYDQRTSGAAGGHDYFEVHPSLHLQYDLTQTQKLSLSYSHRVSRPGAYQTNPFVTVDDEFNGSGGNPDLRPQEAHAVEGGWRWQGEGGRNAAATVYLRKNYNVIGNVDRFLSPTFVLHTSENQGTSTAGGVELDAGGKLVDKLTWRLNTNISYSELQRPSTAGGDTRSAFGYTAKANLDYRMTDNDLIQITGNYAGRRLQSQGCQLPTGGVNIGYRHKFGPSLVAVVMVSDIFASQRQAYVTDTPAIFGAAYNRSPARVLTIGVTRQLGGKPVKEAEFEYGGG